MSRKIDGERIDSHLSGEGMITISCAVGTIIGVFVAAIVLVFVYGRSLKKTSEPIQDELYNTDVSVRYRRN